MDVVDKVDKLKKETVALRKEMIIMKTLMKQQNELIKVLLEEQHECHELGLTPRKWFPIFTQQDLDEFEESVNEANRKEIVIEARRCIKPYGFLRAMNKILHDQLIVDYNLEGNYNKRRLLDYPNLMDVLFKAGQLDCAWDHVTFIKQMRRAMKIVKQKQHHVNRRVQKDTKKEGAN